MPNVREALGKGGCFGREACACCLKASVGVGVEGDWEMLRLGCGNG